MHGERTPAWWSARILLATGIGSVVIGLVIILDVLLPAYFGAMFGGHPTGLSGTLANIAVLGGVVVVMLGGLVWMIRIFRGPSDEPPPWRYRSK
jgi:hypothetical protein